MAIGIDPKWGAYLGLAVIIEQGIGHGTVSLTNLIPVSWAPYVTSWANFLAFVGTSIMTYQAAVSAPKAGPLVDVPTPAVLPTVVKILMVAFLPLALLAMAGGSAAAQGIKVRPLTGNLGNDLGFTKPASGNVGQNVLDDALAALAKPFQDIAAFIGEDAAGAVTLSTAIPNIQDGHGQQCWMAMQSFGAIIKAHPVPITFHVMNDYETLRLLGIATNNLCSNVHCTQVFADATAMAVAASPVPLPIMSLHDLCTKVPQIAVVPAIPVASATAPPAPEIAPAATLAPPAAK